MNEINLFRNEYYFLSNFYPCNILYKSKIYPSAEHFFQAIKTKDEKQREYVRKSKTPKEAKKRGRFVSLRKNWEDIKYDAMNIIVYKKFHQNKDLQELLLSTGDATLIEGNYWHDNYWGRCNCHICCDSGQNNLGIILMNVREKIRNEKS